MLKTKMNTKAKAKTKASSEEKFEGCATERMPKAQIQTLNATGPKYEGTVGFSFLPQK
jgi:hypothetical protein